jgi:hypothetical protein
MEIDLPDPEAQLAFGEALGRLLPRRLVVYLEGDLGTGKTTLVRGLLRGLGHSGPVRSPTYTLIEPYELPAARVYHLDLYRQLRGRLDAADQQAVAGAGAGDVEEVALGVVDLFEVGLVGDGLDALLQRQHLVVAGHDGDGRNSRPLARCMVPMATCPGSARRVASSTTLKASPLDRGPGAVQLGLGTHEDADLVRQDALLHGARRSSGDGIASPLGVVERLDLGSGPLKTRLCRGGSPRLPSTSASARAAAGRPGRGSGARCGS